MHPSFLKAIIVCVAVTITGCAAPTPSATSSLTTDQGARKVKVSTAKALKEPQRPNTLFALIGPQGDSWELISVSRNVYPRRQGKQEVFLVSEDLAQWETTIPSHKHCGSNENTGYSVCTSALAKREMNSATIGGAVIAGVLSAGLSVVAGGWPMLYDEDAINQAVNSIPEAPAKELIAQVLSAEKTAKRELEAAAPERAQQQAEKERQRAACHERYDAETRRLNELAASAIAAMNAGKQLSLMERTDIRRAQQRMSSLAGSTCW